MAILYLPNDHMGDVVFHPKTGEYTYPTFSRGSLKIRHRLPVLSEYRTCIVEVNLRPGVVRDDSSWQIIAYQAAQIVHLCVNSMSGIGGRTVTGEHSGISIMVFAAENGGQGLLNNTIASVNANTG